MTDTPDTPDAPGAGQASGVPSPQTPAAAARLAGALAIGEDGFESGAAVDKTPTGIPGFDHVAMGGLPKRRATVVAGQAGSAKTLFAAQFLAEGIRRGEPGVFVTLEEPASHLRTNLGTLGWDVASWEEAGDWAFVDGSPLITSDNPAYTMDTLAAQIGHAVDRTGAERLALDSLSGVLALQPDAAVARRMLRRLVASLRGMGLTMVLTIETPGDPGGALSRYGVEEFVADNVVLLRNTREGTFRRRTVEVLKMRGAMHHKGDVPFTVVPGQGLVVLPVTAPREAPVTADVRVATGNPGLDELTHGGLMRASSTLLSGPTGTGKTMLATQFAGEGVTRGEKVLVFAYEESREQVLANGASFGYDFAQHERDGLLHIVSLYPEVASLDDHLVEIRELIGRVAPDRLVVDSLSALERLGSELSYRAFVINLTSFVKTAGVASMLTASAGQLLGDASVTQSHISGLIDAIVLLRHVETRSELRRGILVLRMRGSSHEHQIRELVISDGSIELGPAFTEGSPLLGGHAGFATGPGGPTPG